MGYNGLFMGCARGYWLDILKRLRSEFGAGPFMWSSVYKKCPEITKSNLTRLKSSEWIEMDGKKKKTGMWKLTGSAFRLLDRIEDEQRRQRRVIRRHQNVGRLNLRKVTLRRL
jgi:hypothetical protein